MTNWQKIKQNPDLKQHFLMREQVLDGIRSFFKGKGFHEVETPQLVRYPGTEPFLEVFQTKLQTAEGQSQTGYLITSPEYAMKKLLSAGMGNIFQICKAFRNGEGLSSRHNPEFTILEWYRVDADYTDVMKDCEEMILFLLNIANVGLKNNNWIPDQVPPIRRASRDGNHRNLLFYQGRDYDLTSPWPRISVAQAFQKYAQVDTKTLLDEQKLLQVGKDKGYQVDENTTWEQIYNQIFANEIEPELAKLNTPMIVYDYPVSQAALSRKKKSDPRFAERFEFYIAGLEIGNAFSELNDAVEQEARIDVDLLQRDKLGKVKYGKDQDFVEALREGMPESAGIAVGVDRLVMLLSNSENISETLFFPAKEVFEMNV